MILISRRGALRTIGCSCIGAATYSTQVFGASNLARGCLLTARGYDVYRGQGEALFSLTDTILVQSTTHRSTGNADLDRELNRAIRRAADTLEVNPAFGFFDPDKFREPGVDGINAFAWEYDVGVPGTKGLVGFGATLFRNELFGYDQTGSTVMAIIAHEFGHVLQSLRGYLHRISVLQSEINADFLSGYYLGNRRLSVPSVRLEPAEDLFGRLGESSNGDPKRTHGNSQERISAVRAGFNMGFNRRASLSVAIKAGWDHISYSPN